MFLVIIFTLIAILIHHIPVPLLFGTHIYFTDIIFFAAIRLIGLPYALLVTIITSVVALFTGGSIVTLVTSIIKVAIIGLLWIKRKKDFVTWSFVYILLVFLSYPIGQYLAGDLPTTLFHFEMVKEIVTLLFCALVADIISDYLPIIKGFRTIFRSTSSFYFGKIISHIILFATIFPLLLIVFIVAKSLENDMYQTLQYQADSFKNRVAEEASSLELSEIMEFRLESDLQKANLYAIFSEFIGNRNQQVILFNNYGEAWLTINQDQIQWSHKDDIQNGIGKTIMENGFIYIPQSGESLNGWHQSSFISSTSMLSSEAFLIVPLEESIVKIIKQLYHYLIFLLAVILVALLFTIIINRILTKSIFHITSLATNLPIRMKNNEALNFKATRIREFDELANNIKQVATELRHMFSVIERKNKQLTEKTDQLMESENKLFRLAHYDSLTLLGNRNKFYEELPHIIRRTDLQEQEFCLFFIDLDRFKEVNDTYGHQTGDVLLKRFGRRLLEFKASYPEFTPYRLAGDEFVGVLRFVSKEEVTIIRKELEHICEQPIQLNNKLVIHLTASIGVSFYPDDGATIDDLLHEADQKMYERKVLRDESNDG